LNLLSVAIFAEDVKKPSYFLYKQAREYHIPWSLLLRNKIRTLSVYNVTKATSL
jgi:hypothetical protein